MKTRFTEKISGELLKKMGAKDWYRHGIYRDNLFCTAIIPLGMGLKFFKREGLPSNFFYIKQGFNAYITDTDMRKLADVFYAKIKKGGVAYIKKYRLGHARDFERLLDYSYMLKRIDFKNKSNKEIADYLSAYFQKIIDTAHWLWSMEFFNPALDRHLKMELGKTTKTWTVDTEARINDFLINISFLKEKLDFQKEVEDVVRYGNRILADRNLMNLLHAKYAWLNMNTFDGRPFTISEYSARIKKMLKDPRSLKQKAEEGKRKAMRAEKLVAGVKNSELRKMLEETRKLIYLKTYRIDVYTLSWYNAWALLAETYSRIGIKYEDLLKYTPEDILSALRSGGKLEARELKKRSEFAVLLWKDKLYHFYGKAVKKLMKTIDNNDFSSIKQLRGLAAQKGVVRGPARITLTDKDIHKIKKGDILVANLTNPNYNPAFEKIAGVITDEGGVLCHSAIMAREFGIPCIIGTKIATKVLKDGMTVEVDANDGIIRILK